MAAFRPLSVHNHIMSFNTFGLLFRVTTFGESHGPAIGCVVDGCPPRIPLTEADIQQGCATISLNTPGVFRVSIFDRRTHVPLHGLPLRAHCDNTTINLPTDENGAILFLISPMQFGINIDIEKATISVASL